MCIALASACTSRTVPAVHSSLPWGRERKRTPGICLPGVWIYHANPSGPTWPHAHVSFQYLQTTYSGLHFTCIRTGQRHSIFSLRTRRETIDFQQWGNISLSHAGTSGKMQENRVDYATYVMWIKNKKVMALKTKDGLNDQIASYKPAWCQYLSWYWCTIEWCLLSLMMIM